MTRRLEELLSALGRGGVPPEAAEHAAARRLRTTRFIEELDGELSRSRGRRQKLLRLLAAAAVVAAAGLVLSSFVTLRSPAAGGALFRVTDGHVTVQGAFFGPERELRLAGWERVHAEGGGSARLRTPGGALVELASLSDARFESSPGLERVQLLRGSAAFEVPRLEAGRVMEVWTFDTRVVVHGTRFVVRVHVEPGATPFTELELSEGTVAVESGGRTERLRSPARYQSRPSEAAVRAPPAREHAPVPARAGADASALPAPVPAPILAPESARRTAARTDDPSGSARLSSLAEENALFEQVTAAERANNLVAALASAERLLRERPRSPLAHNAEVERMRILARLGRLEDASRAARDYLARNPNGFAAREARAILDQERR